MGQQEGEPGKAEGHPLESRETKAPRDTSTGTAVGKPRREPRKSKKERLTLLVHGQHEGPVLRMQEQEHWGPQEILGQVAQQRGGPERGGGIRVAMASAPATPFPPRSCAHLSSTSWKRQLGVCRVVKILLSGGIRGAEAQEVWPLGFIQSGPASLPRFSRGAQAGWQSSPWLCPGPSSLQR